MASGTLSGLLEEMKCLLKVPNLQFFHFGGEGVKLHFEI